MGTLIDRHLNKAIDKFNIDKETALKSGKKCSASYGKWNDKWNIDEVLINTVNSYLIDKIINY